MLGELLGASNDWNRMGSTLGGMGGSVGHTSVRNPWMW